VSSGSSERPKSISEFVERIRVGAERAAAARHDPALQAKAAEEYEGRVVDLPEVRRKHRERDWRARGIPERLWAMFHDGAPDEPVGPLAPKPCDGLEAVGRFMSPAESRTILLLAGPVGAWKTASAAWAAAWAPGAVFAKAIEVIRQGMYPSDPGFLPRLHGARLLVLDDLAAEPLDGKGYAIAAITDLVDRRYDAARKTIITVNLPLEQFRERYGSELGARLWRRIVEVGRFVELPARKA
jgi:hypothetical protein